MYSKDLKLPHWQQRAQSPTYRRTSFGRRLRIVVVLAFIIYLYHRYSKPVGAENPVDEIISHKYPQSRDELVNHPRIVTRAGNPDLSEVAKEERAEVAILLKSEQSSLNVHDVDDLTPLNLKDVVEASPLLQPSSETEHDVSPDSKVPLGMSNESEQRNAEPEDDEVLEKGTVKANGDRKSVAGLEKGGRAIENAPPQLVMEASQKLIEQHLGPAVVDDTDNGKEKEKEAAKSGPQRFPAYTEYAELDGKADTLPDIIHTPFEVSIQDVTLQGWEDLWFSEAELDVGKYGKLNETKIDFVYTWVNGSEQAFQDTIYPYELNSTLNDPEGKWLESHRVNRYRDWDELRYSIRSVEKYASNFRNKIQLLVNSVADPSEAATATVENPALIVSKQRPLWLKDDQYTRDTVQILSQEDFFDSENCGCLPTFNSLTIENQIFNTKSDTDRLFALSDDMLLGKPHAASDIYSPLFGPTMGFKTNSYNTINPPTDLDARRFGEKPFLIYTSWLLNRRFGDRKRKGQIHFGHSLSRSVTREAINSFPRPALQSACQRFRGETGFQLYSWYVAFHYTIERHREALLWSYIMLRSDADNNGNLNFSERQIIMADLEEGMLKEGQTGFRKRMYYHMSESLEEAGLEAPKVNVDVQWTSLDGPSSIKDIECFEFNVNECLAPGFSAQASDERHTNHVFSTASIFDRVTRQHPKCGDCLIKLLLNRVEKGLSPLLPDPVTQKQEREVVIKALWKYQYVIVDPDAYFVMITDEEQVENVLFKRLIKRRGKVGQLCLNDDVSTEEEEAVEGVRKVMIRLLEGMCPEPSAFERERDEEEIRREVGFVPEGVEQHLDKHKGKVKGTRDEEKALKSEVKKRNFKA